MASYAEYRAKYQEPKATDDDALTTQIDEAAQAQTAREQAADNLPERFAGKTAAEIAASYSELESAYGRQSQTLGDQRKQLDSLLQSEMAQSVE